MILSMHEPLEHLLYATALVLYVTGSLLEGWMEKA